MSKSILTCSPLFMEAALNELRREHPTVAALPPLAPGFIPIEARFSFARLTEPWRARLPIYLHHLFPVHTELRLTRQPDDLERLKAAADRLCASHGSGGITVQARCAFRYDADAEIDYTADWDEQIVTATGTPVPVDLALPYTPRAVEQHLNPAQSPFSTVPPRGLVLSILLAQTGDELCASMGISPAKHNLSPYAGGQVPITCPVPNRAGFKLLEALAVFDLRLRRGAAALDLGASPGAWTTLLRQQGLRVTAVAPTKLYPWLMFDAGVEYHALRAEVFLDRCRTTYDLIVNDMKLDAQDSARLMVAYARHLRPGGIALMTLKLRQRNVQRVTDHAFRLLRKAYKIIRVRQLVSNRQEVTLFLRRREDV